jgi:streptogramin lyase
MHRSHSTRSCFMVLALLAALLATLPSVAWASPTISEFLTGNGPGEATAGPDGNVWFVESGANKIGRLTTSGSLTEFSAGLSANAGLVGITAGPDGNLWFTESSANRIGRITPAGVITEFSTGITTGSAPHGIATGPDGNLWFTEAGKDKVARITTAGSVTEFATGITAGANPWGITAGPDRNLWFTEHGGPGRVARLTTGGVITEFATPSGQPAGITAGPDGNVWFTETAKPGHIALVTASGVISEFSAGLTNDCGPKNIVAGTDGNVYFTESSGPGGLGQITPAGVISEFSTGLSSATNGIAVGGDGNIWFTEVSGNRAGRLTIAPAALTRPPLATSQTAATLSGLVTPNSQATTYIFQWGTTTAYGNSTAITSAGACATAQQATAAISGLTNLTTYHYRVVASNASGTTNGQDEVFVAQASPIVTTDVVSSLGVLSATVNATVNPNSQATSYHFEWGPTASYGNWLPLIEVAVGSDSTEHSVSQTLVGLTAGTTYHVRVVATSAGGTSNGEDRTFTTPLPPPTSITGSASGIDEATETLTASVDPNGSPTTYHFEFGPTTDYGTQWPSADAPVTAGVGPQPLAETVSGLAPDTLYHYRVFATSPFGITYGSDATFTTMAAAPPAASPIPTSPSPPAGGSRLPPATRPVFGTSATISRAVGTVLVRLPHTSGFVTLTAASTVPMGTIINATNGKVAVADVRDHTGRLQHGTFWGGTFTLRQGRTKDARTVLTLARLACRSTARSTAAMGAPRRISRLWGRDNHGRFVTHGHSAVATVRGTAWLVRDTCAGTLVSVSRGVVSVRDLVRHRTVRVSAGHRYIARRR